MAGNAWDYDGNVGAEPAIVGFEARGTDGVAGRVDRTSYRAARDVLVVDVNGVLPGGKRLVPVEAIDAVDPDARTVDLRLTTAQVESAPTWGLTDTAVTTEQRTALDALVAALSPAGD